MPVVTASSSPARMGGMSALRTGVSLGVLSLLAAPSLAFAQVVDGATATAPSATTGGAGQVADSTPTDDPTAADAGDVIVTGIRASLQGARDRKRNAEQVIDSITAQDIGALPDRSVSEALQRVPGVTLQRTNENRDPARLSSEGGGVFIRGLSFVRSELNGRDVFSANSGRALSFEDVSADLLAGVDVYKNPSAELVEGGIGGIINLRTRKPFDATGRVVAFSGDINYADLREKAFISGNALVSDRWQTGIGEIGVLLSYSIGNIGNRTDSVSASRYDRATLSQPQDGFAAGSTVYLPNALGFRRIDWQQRRTAFDGSIQWRPAPNLQFTAEALIATASPRDIEFNVGDYDPLPADNATYTFGESGNLETATVTNRNLNFNTRAGSQRRKTEDYSLNMRWDTLDNLSIGADVQYIRSAAEVYSMTAFTQAAVPATIALDLSQDKPGLSITPTGGAAGAYETKSAYWWAAAMDHIEDNDADELAARMDVEYTFPDDGILRSFRAGGRISHRDATTRQTGYNWALLSAQYWGGGTPVKLTDTGFAGGPQNPGLPDQTTFQAFPNFFSNKIAAPAGGFWFPSAGLVQNGTANAYSYLKSTLSAGWGWTPLSDDYEQSAASTGGVNEQSETTQAGYALLRFGRDGVFDGNVGVRIVGTQTVASGAPVVVTPPTGSPTTCVVGTRIDNGPRAGQSVTAADCALYAQAFAFAGGAISGTGSRSGGSYTDVLPSANLRFFLKDNLQLRLAAAKAIIRPTFAQLSSFVQLGYSFDATTNIATGNGVGGRVTPFTGSAGSTLR